MYIKDWFLNIIDLNAEINEIAMGLIYLMQFHVCTFIPTMTNFMPEH